MDEKLPRIGDVITATVTKTLPFGVLVEHADAAGLVRGAQSAPGARLSLRVIEVDRVLRRFAAEVA
ncbi:hypothetical protein NFX31_00245 [Microbacterium azadirachtae]|uniref:hypothetical protein n=1 Tax=Microbacterium azadirachtae TaxID=582680 RepID=UPI0021D4C336|nr:hypothetical protein [Microbacterium azadirachtae]UXW86003.1 hypothetical protein NFX31_00245 [Microbacterium azadirachtae]